MQINMDLPFKLLFVFLLEIQVCFARQEVNPARQIISQYKIVFNDPLKKIPVPYSVDAPMLENGFTGVAISGQPEKQVCHLARNDFWRLKSSLNHSFPAVLGKLEIDIPGFSGKKIGYKRIILEGRAFAADIEFPVTDAVRLTIKNALACPLISTFQVLGAYET